MIEIVYYRHHRRYQEVWDGDARQAASVLAHGMLDHGQWGAVGVLVDGEAHPQHHQDNDRDWAAKLYDEVAQQ